MAVKGALKSPLLADASTALGDALPKNSARKPDQIVRFWRDSDGFMLIFRFVRLLSEQVLIKWVTAISANLSNN
ncbi:hypothetical protein [Pseudomonas lijiangensis]|uniref:Uncharacterized protein n=1 Tax=Pseudomonas lijiangensis TaxID=2995658 RepID=A0ABX8HWH8_9PSED|nr:hypothetical protein [Pseudomonas lijiangensis]MBX8499405.1 hypothetical protein [Pseudomonas lijiangensis]MBX8507213.1 hypothetical protein [Pseudomonas lijiangensis]QWU84877.1 hypothetical protein KQP88_09000 [Pseudomonas lijiangensis]